MYESTRELDSWIGTHTHTHRVIVYICLLTNSMTTCRPASVLLLIYGSIDLKVCRSLGNYKIFEVDLKSKFMASYGRIVSYPECLTYDLI